MRTFLAALAVTVAAVLAPSAPAAADTTTQPAAVSWIAPGVLEAPKFHVHPRGLRVTYTERMQVPGRAPLLYTEFNDGRVVAFRPCRYEDGSGPRERREGCYWNARKRGNGIGDSAILYRGRLFLLDTRAV